MIVSRHGCRLLPIALALALSAPAARAESLEEAWSIALAVDQRLRAAAETTDSAEETLASTKAARCPTMTNEAGYFTLSDKPAYKADLDELGTFPIPFVQQGFAVDANLITQPLFTSGRISNGIAAAKAGVQAAQSDEARTVLDVKIGVADAYVNVLYSQQLVRVAEGNVTALEAHVKAVGELVKQAQRARSDLLAAQVQLADGRQQALQARNQLDIGRAAYNRYLGRCFTDPVQLDELEPPVYCEDLDALTAQALAQRPELAALLFQQQALCRQADAVRAETKPQVAALGGLLYVQDRYFERDAFALGGVAVRWDLDCGATRHRANALVRRACAVAAQRADTETQIALQVRQAFLDAQTARQRVEVTKVAIEQAEDNLRQAVDRYKNGVGTNTEVLDAVTLRLRSSGNYYNALYNWVLAVMRLRRAVGDL
jgi:outer membrane protein